MKENILTVQIQRPLSIVLSFVLNPKNTPQWISSIVEEQTSEWPVKNGTRYRNQNTSGQWNTYLLRDLTETGFTMDQEGSAYHVRYTLTPVGKGETKLTYTEWVDEGDIAEPFTSDILDVLKACVENI